MSGNGEHLHSCTTCGTTDLVAGGSCRWLHGSFAHPLTQSWHQHVDGFVPKSHLFGISRTQNIITGCEQGCFPLRGTFITYY